MCCILITMMFLQTEYWPRKAEDMSRFTYRLIAKQDVDIRHDLHQGLFEELADERR